MEKPYVYDNREFNSIQSLAEYAGVNEKTVSARLKRGMSVDDACRKERLDARVYTYDNQKFNSVTELAEYAGIGFSTLNARLKRGIPIDIACRKERVDYRYTESTVYTYDNHEFNSVKALAEYAGINYLTLYKRLKKGMPVETACKKPGGNLTSEKIYEYDGHEFYSVRSLARYAGISHRTLSDRLEKGIPVDIACQKGKLDSRYTASTVYTYDNQKFYSVKALAEYAEISHSTLGWRLRKGIPVDIACQKEKLDSRYTESTVYTYDKREFHSIAELAAYAGINYNTLCTRLEAGIPVDIACQNRKMNHRMGTVYTYDNHEFHSVKALAEYAGISCSTLNARLKREIPIDIACRKGRLDARVYTYDNQKFNSVTELAEYAGISCSTLNARLKRGIPIDIACRKGRLDYRPGNVYAYDNYEFHSVKSLAEYAGVNEKTVSARLGRGLSVDDACRKERLDARVYTYDNQKFNSVTELAEYAGISRSTLNARLKRGIPIDIACRKERMDYKSGNVYAYDNHEFHSVRALAEYAGISCSTLNARLKKGMSIMDACEKKKNMRKRYGKKCL